MIALDESYTYWKAMLVTFQANDGDTFERTVDGMYQAYTKEGDTVLSTTYTVNEEELRRVVIDEEDLLEQLSRTPDDPHMAITPVDEFFAIIEGAMESPVGIITRLQGGDVLQMMGIGSLEDKIWMLDKVHELQAQADEASSDA